MYKSEIERIWRAQLESLSKKEEPQLTEEDEERVLAPKETRVIAKNESSIDLHTAFSPPRAVQSGPPSPAFSRGSSIDREVSLGPETSQRVLRIKRLVR